MKNCDFSYSLHFLIIGDIFLMNIENLINSQIHPKRRSHRKNKPKQKQARFDQILKTWTIWTKVIK